jgi:hypothetical protein
MPVCCRGDVWIRRPAKRPRVARSSYSSVEIDAAGQQSAIAAKVRSAPRNVRR